MRIHISTAPARPKPKVGDRRMLRGVEHVRVFARSQGAYVVSNGRPCFDWVPLSELPRELSHLRDKPGRWVGKARPA